jgi:predicted PurR-regulated permease PerM
MAMARARGLEGSGLPVSGSPKRLVTRPDRDDHEHVDRISSRTIIFILVVLGVFLQAIRWVLLPFLIAGLTTYLCTPLVEWLAARTRLPRAVAATAVFAVLLALAASIASLSASFLSTELFGVATDFQSTLQGLARDLIGGRTVTLFGHTMSADELAQAAVAEIAAWIRQMGGMVVLGGFAVGSAFGLLLTAVLLFYFLQSGPQMARDLLWLIPPRQRPLIRRIWQRLDPVLWRYLMGVIIVVAYAAAAAYVGLGLFLRLPHALFLALLTGILEMIPMVGPAAAVAIAGLIAVKHATGAGPILAYAVYAALLRLSIDQLFGPLALGAAARMHPALVIFCFLSGGVLFGIAGVILALPVALTVRITLAALYDEPLEPADSARDISS